MITANFQTGKQSGFLLSEVMDMNTLKCEKAGLFFFIYTPINRTCLIKK